MTRSWSWLICVVVAAGCLPDSSDKDSGRGRWNRSDWGTSSPYYTTYDWYYYSSSTTGDTEGFGPEDVTVTLSSTGVQLTLVEAPGPMSFGMIETGLCGEDCWIAEGCVEASGDYAFCHESSETGLTLTLAASPDGVINSETTLVSEAQEGSLTFMLSDGTDCYTWGTTPGYYITALGCTVW